MRTRDEVLREYSRPYQSHEDVGGPDADRMADRLRELESQQAASEQQRVGASPAAPVAWGLYHGDNPRPVGASLVKLELGPESVGHYRYAPLYAHPSAAGVSEAERRVLKAAERIAMQTTLHSKGETLIGWQTIDASDLREFMDAVFQAYCVPYRRLAIAALTAASEGASDA